MKYAMGDLGLGMRDEGYVTWHVEYGMSDL